MAAATQPLAVIAKLLDLSERRVQQLSREGVIPKATRGPASIIPRRKAERDLFRHGRYGAGAIPVWGVDKAGRVQVARPIQSLTEAEALALLRGGERQALPVRRPSGDGFEPLPHKLTQPAASSRLSPLARLLSFLFTRSTER